MTTQEPPMPPGPNAGDDAGAAAKVQASGQPLTTLRGAGVDVDVRRVGQVILALLLLALTVLVVVLFVAGVHKNAQINQLRQQGVPVNVTVTGCRGLLGGSGSNAAGYACRGTFTAGGHRYDEAIPGSAFYAPGAIFHAIRVPGDPALLSSVHAVANEHASWRVFLLPTILLIILVLAVGGIALRRRHTRSASSGPPPST